MPDQAQPISSVHSLQLDLPPSCVEFCPAFPSYFVVGTYNLQKDDDASRADEGVDGNSAGPKTQSRNGSLVTFRVEDEKSLHVQTTPQPSAILDLRFSPHPGQQHICVAVSSTGTIAMFSLSGAEDEPLKETGTATMAMLTKGVKTSESEVLFLAFCWHPSKKDTVAVSTSEGGIHLVQLAGSSHDWTMAVEPVLTHSLEAWCVTIHAPLSMQTQDEASGSFVVYSGGDDSNLFYTKCRDTSWLGEASDEEEARVTHRVRGHDAGVTAILLLDELEPDLQLAVTGSYDDHIRLFGIGSNGGGGSKLLAESNLGGGVWRLKMVRVGSGGHSWRAIILASCMHAGARIVELSKSPEGVYGFRILGSFVEHQSMNYGSDFQPGRQGDLLIVSTSFYDKLLCLWRYGGSGAKAVVG